MAALNPYPSQGPKSDPWTLDPKSPEFAAEARRQSLMIANSPQEKDDMAFIESIYSLAWPEE